MTNKWEYLIVTVYLGHAGKMRSMEELNQLGDEGWEAISAWAEYDENRVLLRRPK